ncbi:MAG: hypothetical protein NZM43_11105, partial [Saprospiraceae bacterium]|nr:hypothetical protein [Saprospiraceae bacterium]MDW8484855.1 hypothetical protein [Saprospiraceae bacterium]
MAIAGVFFLSFWAEECHLEYFPKPVPTGGKTLSRFPQEIAGNYFQLTCSEDSMRMNLVVYRFELPTPWQMIRTEENYVLWRAPENASSAPLLPKIENNAKSCNLAGWRH